MALNLSVKYFQRSIQLIVKNHQLIGNKINRNIILKSCRFNSIQFNHKQLINCNFKTQTNKCSLLNNTSNHASLSRASFNTSSPRFNPIVSIVLRNAAKVIAAFTGRALRKWWKNLPANKRQLIKEWIMKHKWKFMSFGVSIIGLFCLYYYMHIEETPITKRKRFIAFTSKQFEEISKFEFNIHLEMFKNKLLPSVHPETRRVAKVATQLLNGNNDINTIHDKQWTISVVDDPNVKNAFVMPNGQIFVFTGMLKLCDNDDQLGIVLAHEMAHAVLAHGAELVSHAHIIDLIFISIIALIWTVFPTDLIASLSTFVSRAVMEIIVNRPYSRFLETEADIVGLELAAKSCFDVRESSAFWHKMSFIEKIDSKQYYNDNTIEINSEFLSTHPTHEKRYIYLDSIMDDAIKLRDKCNCPKLPRMDPRIRTEMQMKIAEETHEKNKFDGVIALPKPQQPVIVPPIIK